MTIVNKLSIWVKLLVKFKISNIVYHVDRALQNDSFIDGHFYPSPESGKWCGEGMYFWDNLSNADFWVKTKQRRRPDNYSIAGAELICSPDDVLDLTDDQIGKQLKEVAKQLSVKYGVDLDLNSNGVVINFVHNIFEKQHTKLFSVVKEIGYYPNKNPVGLIGANEPSEKDRRRSAATSKARVIYAVRDNSLIQHRFSVNRRSELRYELPF